MSNLTMVEATLPPGFRFHPRDDELICDYLSNKVSLSISGSLDLLVQVDLNKCEPWDLPETACVGGKEWYFYSQRDRKYATGLRTNRATVSGYWKATGKDRCILRNRTLVGMRKTLVFYLGRAPKGNKTDWVMHEFRLQGPLAPPLDSSLKEDWVLCRIFCKSKEIRHEDSSSTTGTSSSLPPLMDSNTNTVVVSFDQSEATCTNMIDQVPCFSIINNNIFNKFDHNNNNSSSSTRSEKNSNSNSNTVIKAILSRFQKMDHHNYNHNIVNSKDDSTTLSFHDHDQSISDQSFLSDAALPVTMWYP